MLGVELDANVKESRLPIGYGGMFYGVYSALVVDIVDPDNQGRIKIQLPWALDAESAVYEVWARLATFMAGNDRGSWFIPDVDDEVLVCFEAGDTRRPYVLGGLWNGQDAPPESMDNAGRNDIKKLQSRNGVTVTLDDTDGQEKFIVNTPGGQKIELKDGPGVIEVRDSTGNFVKMETSGMTINAVSKITVNATMVEVSAATVTVNAGMSRFSGLLQADSIITNSIVSASYTPGAGNIW